MFGIEILRFPATPLVTCEPALMTDEAAVTKSFAIMLIDPPLPNRFPPFAKSFPITFTVGASMFIDPPLPDVFAEASTTALALTFTSLAALKVITPPPLSPVARVCDPDLSLIVFACATIVPPSTLVLEELLLALAVTIPCCFMVLAVK